MGNTATQIKDNKEPVLTGDILRMVEECKAGEHPESQLIAVLHEVQVKYGYLPRNIMDEIAQMLQIPAATVSGVASFYHFFSLLPKGQYDISVCMGTACFVKGADKLMEVLQNELGIGLGETTSDGLFSLSISRCLGICALAPIITINEKVYSQVTPRQVSTILNEIREEVENKKGANIEE